MCRQVAESADQLGVKIALEGHDEVRQRRYFGPSPLDEFGVFGFDVDVGMDAAFRELEEEIGTAKAELLAEAEDWLDYDLPHELVAMLWQGRFRGQTQKWFAMRFTGVDGDIDIATETPEFIEWRWAEVPTLPDLIVPFKRDLYAELVKRFGHLAGEVRGNTDS